jgi:hypothetical protein
MSAPRLPEMEPVVAALLRRFDHQLLQLDPAVRLEGQGLHRLYYLGDEMLAVISPHRDLFRLRTGAEPVWEARIREPDEALEGLARVLDHYWRLVARLENSA